MLRYQRIQSQLKTLLNPTELHVTDESHMHQRPGVETHYQVIAVATHFTGMTRIARHRLVYRALADELSTGLHALSLQLFTPEEWALCTQKPHTPPCIHQPIQ